MKTEPTHPTPSVADPESWVENHLDVLMGYAMLRVRDTELAEDLVQETLAAAWQGRDRFEGRSNERTWLIGILKHRILDHYRRCWREQPVTALSADPEGDRILDRLFDEQGMWKRPHAESRDHPRGRMEVEEFMEQMRRCLARLPPRHADAFILRELEQLDSPEICQALGVNPTNLWQLMHRARLGLRACLEKAGVGPPLKGGS
jgi:RNA polymerase sigma-70 factor, ECF subfamily